MNRSFNYYVSLAMGIVTFQYGLKRPSVHSPMVFLEFWINQGVLLGSLQN